MYQIYQVQSYDTLQSIANKFNTTTDELIKINGLTNYTPILGAPLIVPRNMDEARFDSYIVKKGDSLYSISREYNMTPNALALLNGIEINDYIYPGQELMVPKQTDNIYVVLENDTLSGILDELNIDIYELLDRNKEIFLKPEQIIFYKKKR